MKKIKLPLLLLATVTITAVTFQSCTKNDETAVVNQSNHQQKIINFKGLQVNHRFKTKESDLNLDKATAFNKVLHKKRNEYYKEKGIFQKKVSNEEIDMKKFTDAVNQSTKYFPYQDTGTDLEMIQRDFPTLSEQEIYDNSDKIDDYYSRNLNDMVASMYLEEINDDEDYYGGGGNYNTNPPIMPDIVRGYKNLGESTRKCTLRHLSIDWWDVRRYVAYHKAGYYAGKIAQEKYPQIGQRNTKRDAYRHTIWNALLANYYTTTSSKKPRLEFAKKVADMNELCGENLQDSAAMDYHNNEIGRTLWGENTSYIKVLGMTTGLRLPSTSRIEELVYNKVEQARYIYKNESYNKDNDKDGSKRAKELERIYWLIKNADKKKIIYYSIETETKDDPYY